MPNKVSASKFSRTGRDPNADFNWEPVNLSDGLHRGVCDYIAGMTDRYAVQEYERLIGKGRMENEE
jgi:dGTP triphosphohydrolase